MDGLLVSREGGLLKITIDRAGDGNRVTSEMAAELSVLLASAAEGSRLVLLQANGKDFSNGWKGPSAGLPHEGAMEAYEAREQFDVIFDCYSAFRKSRVPVVGAIRGRARGFGCAVAGLCDITIASDGARFQIPELSFNVLPTMVMSSLYDRVPAKALGYLVATAEEIDAQAAMQCGIVSRVVPDATLDEHVAALCATLLKRPEPALSAIKEYLGSAARMEPRAAIDYARALHATINTSRLMKPSH